MKNNEPPIDPAQPLVVVEGSFQLVLKTPPQLLDENLSNSSGPSNVAWRRAWIPAQAKHQLSPIASSTQFFGCFFEMPRRTLNSKQRPWNVGLASAARATAPAPRRSGAGCHETKQESCLKMSPGIWMDNSGPSKYRTLRASCYYNLFYRCLLPLVSPPIWNLCGSTFNTTNAQWRGYCKCSQHEGQKPRSSSHRTWCISARMFGEWLFTRTYWVLRESMTRVAWNHPHLQSDKVPSAGPTCLFNSANGSLEPKG